MKMPKTYGDLRINVFPLLLFGVGLNEVLAGMFSSVDIANLELTSIIKTRKLSTYVESVVELYGITTNDEYIRLSEDGIKAIVDNIASSFRYKWSKLKEINNTKYDALKPFNVTLSETAKDTLDTQKDKTTYVDNDGTYGFNSVSSNPTDKTDGESNREYKRTIDNTRDYTRVGNIGNTSFQDLIEQERKIADYNLKDVILRDIATVICRGKYI